MHPIEDRIADFIFVCIVISSLTIAGFFGWKLIHNSSATNDYNIAKYSRCLGECAPYEPIYGSRGALCVCNMQRMVPDAISTREGRDEE